MALLGSPPGHKYPLCLKVPEGLRAPKAYGHVIQFNIFVNIIMSVSVAREMSGGIST
jgi:hypothetical protein